MVWGWIISAIVAAIAGSAIVIALSVMTIEAIISVAREQWGAGRNVLIIDPSLSAEMQDIATTRGSKKYKKIIYDKATKNTLVTESDTMADELRVRKQIEAVT
jgi:hypothetical protein